MPAIAAAVQADHAAFYWHLGDFRALYKFDEDMIQESSTPLTISGYQNAAWPDFIKHQINPFGSLPVFLGIGNHELYGKTRGDFIAQFGDWINRPEVQQQRLADDPNDHTLKTYYHWIQGGVDFITLDNASSDMFDAAQVAWLRRVIARDADDPRVKSVVIGMHRALPQSLGCDHSMNESADGQYTGTQGYRELTQFREKTKKNVYIFASHSHFFMRDVFDSPYWKAHGGVLPGIIVGTAGAIRYRLPDTTAGWSPDRARTDVYGYVLGTVAADGSITFEFKEVPRSAVPADVVARYSAVGVDWCFNENRDLNARSSQPCSTGDVAGPNQRP